MIDAAQLLGPSSPLGYPAPYWFLVCFKILGFTLHMVPMNLWYAGAIVALLLRWHGSAHGAVFATRFMRQLPVIVAYGVNFGIVPLLFTQVAYYKVFYPATILMAWPWFGVVGLLMVAYYGVYLYAAGLHNHGVRMARWRLVAGWAAALLFVTVGFLFANAFSLMTNLRAWPELWLSTSVAGAARGTALNTADPTLWPRWLMMFGLALTTTAAYVTVDAGVLAGRETGDYKRWAPSFALKLYTLGIAWFAIAGCWYVFGTWPPALRQRMFGGPMLILTLLTAVGPALPWLFIAAQARARAARRGFALATGLAQFGVLALNAVSRQVVQNVELGRFLDVTAEPVNIQWSPLMLFGVLLVAGLAVIGWMVSKAVAAQRQAAGALPVR